MRCPISGAGLRGDGVAPAPYQPALWELRRGQPLLFSGKAELRPGETRVAAGSVVAPHWPASPGGHRRVGSRLGRAGEGAQGWGRFGLPGGELAEELVGPLGRLSFGKTLAVTPLVPVDPAAAFSRAADLRPPVAPAAPGQQGPPSSRTEPRAPWSRQALWHLFPPRRVPVRPGRPGLAGKPRPEEVAVQRGIGLWGGAGMGDLSPIPPAPAQLWPQPGHPENQCQTLALPGMWTLPGESPAQDSPGPLLRAAGVSAPGLGTHQGLQAAGL